MSLPTFQSSVESFIRVSTEQELYTEMKRNLYLHGRSFNEELTVGFWWGGTGHACLPFFHM